MDNVAEVFFSYDVLGKGAFGLGALATGWLAGMVVGAAVIARRIPERRQAPVLAVGAIVGGLAIALAALAVNFPFAVAMFALGGVANGVQNVSMRSLIHRNVDEEVRGRVFALYSGIDHRRAAGRHGARRPDRGLGGRPHGPADRRDGRAHRRRCSGWAGSR